MANDMRKIEVMTERVRRNLFGLKEEFVAVPRLASKRSIITIEHKAGVTSTTMDIQYIESCTPSAQSNIYN